MKLPLAQRLRKRLHASIGLLQDELVELVYGLDNEAVLHGGTAIWRCYGGNRFSEDIDLYSKKITKGALEEALPSRGLDVRKLKRTENLIFCKVAGPEAEVRLELNLVANVSSVLKNYERMDGSEMPVLTLSPEDLILEKIEAYKARRYVRDIYDMYHLLPLASDEGRVKKALAGFIRTIEAPVDEAVLKTVVYAGRAPTFKEMLLALRRGAR